MKKGPEVMENFADNGEHSHWSLINVKNGKTLWSETSGEEKTTLDTIIIKDSKGEDISIADAMEKLRNKYVTLIDQVVETLGFNFVLDYLNNKYGEQKTGYESIRLSFKDLPSTYYPGLLSEFLYAAHGKKVWKNGSAVEFVKQIENKIKGANP